jgi:hypothetical protein
MSELTEPQLRALKLLGDCATHDGGWGVVSSGKSLKSDGQAWINFNTARALGRRGLVESSIYDDDEGGEVRLTKRGREVLANA